MTDQRIFRFSKDRGDRLESAGREKRGRKQIGIPGELYDDEVVCFIASRYHTTPRNVLQRFLVQEGVASGADADGGTFRLEENEREILRGLMQGSHS